MHDLKNGFLKIGKNIFALITFVLLSSCTTPTSNSSPSSHHPTPNHALNFQPQNLKDAAAMDYQNIQRLYGSSHFQEGLLKIREFESRHPEYQSDPQVKNLHGLFYLMSRLPLQAIHQFNLGIQGGPEGPPSHSFRSYLLYNRAVAEYEARQPDNVTQTLLETDYSQFDPGTLFKFHFLNAQALQKISRYPDSANEILKAAKVLERMGMERPENQNSHQSLRQSLVRVLLAIDGAAGNEETDLIQKLYDENLQSSLADELLFSLGRKSLIENKLGLAEKSFRDLIARHPTSPRYDQASKHLSSIQESGAANPMKIGALLPLSGRFAPIGERTLHGIQLALRLYQPTEPASKVTLVIEDSGETAEERLAALDRLYFEHRVVAVLGPLVSRDIEAVTRRAQDLGLPLIPLSQRHGSPGDYLFYASMTPDDQVKAIATHAVKQRNFRRFAILHPNNRFGHTYRDQFWDIIEGLGGEIVGVESYEPGETDFRDTVGRLGSLHYRQARLRELEMLKEQREELGITQRSRRTERYYDLPPIVDFDAVFIPDEAMTVGQILPTFAFSSINDVPFLGISTWNSPELARRAGRHAHQSTFVDLYFANSKSPIVRDFQLKFEGTFGYSPSVIEALAFDAASIMEYALLLSGQKASRSEVKQNLMQIDHFPGVTGRLSYSNGRFERDLRILQLQGSRIIELDSENILESGSHFQ
jgi:branched-chain amino acid transport system substrate-binding protein